MATATKIDSSFQTLTTLNQGELTKHKATLKLQGTLYNTEESSPLQPRPYLTLVSKSTSINLLDTPKSSSMHSQVKLGQ